MSEHDETPRPKCAWFADLMAYPSEPSQNAVSIEVVSLHGDIPLSLNVPDSMTGRELQQMISDKLPLQAGVRVCIQHGSSPLLFGVSLLQQGIVGHVNLSYVYQKVNIYAVWSFLKGSQVDEDFILDGVTELAGIESKKLCQNLPNSLRSLTFGLDFNNSLNGVSLPSRLERLTFGHNFRQSLDQIRWPPALQSLTFGIMFNRSLDQVNLPKTLQVLTFDHMFNQSLESVNLPETLRCLTFDYMFNQSLERVALPKSLESLTFGRQFDQPLDQVKLPDGLKSLTLGYAFNQSLESVALPNGLQSLTLGDVFNHRLENVKLPQSLRNLSFGAKFNQNLDNVKLPALESLSFGEWFCHKLHPATLPSSLKNLVNYNHNLDGMHCADSLQSLTFSDLLKDQGWVKDHVEAAAFVCSPNQLQT